MLAHSSNVSGIGGLTLLLARAIVRMEVWRPIASAASMFLLE